MKQKKRLSNGAVVAGWSFAAFLIYNLVWYDQPTYTEFVVSLILLLIMFFIASLIDADERCEEQELKDERLKKVRQEYCESLKNNM